jgi:2,3-bisphosphoglycerate-independent phosphoglycerate mutase
VTTNLKGKFKAAVRVSEKAPFLFLHIKGTDSLSHDGNCQGKKEFIEKIDQAIKPLFSLKEVTVIVTADHCTPCESKQHSTDLIPLLIWSKNRRGDEVEHWGEKECPQGSLGIIQQNQLIEKVLADTV